MYDAQKKELTSSMKSTLQLLWALLGSPPKADAPLAQNLMTDFLVGPAGLEPVLL
jgi:hypothetical protein